MGRLPAPDTPIAEALRAHLADLRRAGQPFDDAWPVALEAVLAPIFGANRREWAQVFSEAREAWRCGYEREPARAFEPFAMLDVRPSESVVVACDAA